MGERMNDDCTRSDPETTRTSQDSPTQTRRVVNTVPTRSQRRQTESDDSLAGSSDSLTPVQFGENNGLMTDSDNSTEGYSLVDDAGDSVDGSAVHSEATQTNSLSTPSHGSVGFGPSRDNRLSSNTLLPHSFRVVQQARRCFWVLWVVGTITVTTSLWAMARNEIENQAADVDAIIDEEQFISKVLFDSQTDLLQQLWKSRLESKLQAMDVLSASMASNAASDEMDWPFVAFPDFERRVASLHEFTLWMPVIRTDSDGSEISSWANYSQWYMDNEQYSDNKSPSFNQRFLADSHSGTTEGFDYYLPVWQHAQPMVPSLLNYDLSSHPQIASTIQAVINTGQPALSRSFLRENVVEDDFFLLSVLPDDIPTMFLFYPILGNFNTTAEQSKVGGIVATVISWEEILARKDVDMPHFQVTIKMGSCTNQADKDSQHLLVELGGTNSVTRFDGDNLQTSNGRQRSLDLTSNVENFGGPLMVEEGSGGCSYILHVVQEETIEFSTTDFQSDSRVPVNIVVGIVVFAIVLALTFLYFDSTVRRRENDLAAEATRTRNIVASLFPSQFHDRLFQTSANGLNNAIRQSEDFAKVFRGVEAAVSSQFELPLEADESSSHKPNSDSGKDGINEKERQGKAEGMASPAKSPSRDNYGRLEDAIGPGTNLGPSTHNKSGGFKDLLSKPTSFRSLHRRSGGNGAEPSFMNRPEQESRPGFGRDLLARATSMRNMLPLTGGDNALLNRSQHGSAEIGAITKDEPIADLFPEATVMFADISGFTAWSSTREPTQVFKLLETIYSSFDRMARKRRVFKVETIGDCYMAVTGVPDPQPDHAVIMVQFAKECLIKMRELTRKLEASLGPETGDLCMRFGLHSGPVTAGVLRGEKSRFQLFGDTVNFASRMESTGKPKRIQVSGATAELLIEAGKENWVQLRDDLVNAKGKGLVQTYWVFPKSNSMSSDSVKSLGDSIGSMKGQIVTNQEKINSLDSSVQLKTRTKRSLVAEGTSPSFHSTNTSETLHASRRSMLSSSHHSQVWAKEQHIGDPIEEEYDGFEDDGRQERLIDWNVKILARFLRRIQASRQVGGGGDEVPHLSKPRRGRRVVEPDLVFETKPGETAFDEITEIIPLATTARHTEQSDTSSTGSIDLPVKVELQLRKYVTNIAFMYRDNFFHNFEHASHVLMSSQKLLQRVIGADKNGESGSRQNEHAWIIASDPLTQFAIVFASLIHDVDHTGVPNAQLVKEKAHVASLYKNRSVAEQNSLELAWEMLMSREYRDLQRAIFANQDELRRFRQLIVNVVLATDIFDPEMVQIRNSRWEKAFGKNAAESDLSEQDIHSLKATIVIEYIMQASDVSHSMQHWHVYQKWNERLFEEMYSAFQVGRGDKDPSLGWYKGELWFFDNYVIPLAKKLKESEVFGAASSQFLKFALDNREEWERKGEGIVARLVEKHSQQLL